MLGGGGLTHRAGEAAAKPGCPCPPSSCRLAAGAEVLQRLHQSTQHQYRLQARPAKDFSGPEPSTQVEALPSWPRRPSPGQLGACLPNKETKAFVGPGLRVVTSSCSLQFPCARHGAEHWTWISWVLTTGRELRHREVCLPNDKSSERAEAGFELREYWI